MPLSSKRDKSIQKMSQLRNDPDFGGVLDFETTGKPDYKSSYFPQPVQIALISPAGETLLYTKLYPEGETIHPEASKVHGITLSDVLTAPKWADIFPELQKHLEGKRFLAYNASFELGVLEAACKMNQTPYLLSTGVCAMLAYADYAGIPGKYGNSFKWHKLSEAMEREALEFGGDAHDALADVKATLQLMEFMAAAEVQNDAD